MGSNQRELVVVRSSRNRLLSHTHTERAMQSGDEALMRSLTSTPMWKETEQFARDVASLYAAAAAGHAPEALMLSLLAHRQPWYDSWGLMRRLPTESPLEQVMAMAIYLSALSRWPQPTRVMAWPGDWPPFDMDSQPGTTSMGRDQHGLLAIIAQHRVLDYRLDLLLLAERPTESGVMRGVVCVECDGHDFHERTPEQAEHDKRRDRRVQIAGIPVLRFTGREIWRDAMGCAAQALTPLDAVLGLPIVA